MWEYFGLILNHHRCGDRGAGFCESGHSLDTQMALTDVGVAVRTRAARGRTVVEVNEGQKAGVLGCEALDVVEGMNAAVTDKHVAGVNADAEARIRAEGGDEGGELLVGAEHLRALAGRCLQKEGTVRGGVWKNTCDVGAHIR